MELIGSSNQMPETVANEAKPMPARKLLASDPYSQTIGEQWRKNRCTQLLGFACLIFVVGTGYLLYRQNKFVPVGFPGGDAFQFPAATPAATPAVTPGTTPAADNAIPAEAASIVVIGAQNDRGVLRVAIYDSATGFNDLKQAIRKTTLQIRGGEATAWVPIDSLPESFAMAVFHDENENGELDRNRLKIPTERYGFSNDARGVIGPPSFEDAKIDCPKAGQSINVSIR